MWVVFTITVCTLAAFLFHFLQVSSYQRQASSILQKSSEIPSYSLTGSNYSAGSYISKSKDGSSSDYSDNTASKLDALDKRYNYDFNIEPATANESNSHITESDDNSSNMSWNNHFSNGDHMYYMIHIHIPYLSLGATSTSNKFTHHAIFKWSIPVKVICQTSNDNDSDSHQD